MSEIKVEQVQPRTAESQPEQIAEGNPLRDARIDTGIAEKAGSRESWSLELNPTNTSFEIANEPSRSSALSSLNPYQRSQLGRYGEISASDVAELNGVKMSVAQALNLPVAITNGGPDMFLYYDPVTNGGHGGAVIDGVIRGVFTERSSLSDISFDYSTTTSTLTLRNPTAPIQEGIALTSLGDVESAIESLVNSA